MTSDRPADGALNGVRELIRTRMVEERLPSLAVAVARHGQILWEEGFGWADRERRVPADEHTMYSLASISKPITATGIMVLKERGKLDLDRPINDYLGAVKINTRIGDAAQATVRRVANHTSGLPLHFQFFYADELYCRPPMDETIRRYGNLMTPPGEHHQYSNLGYGILDEVISRLSGKSYIDFMREEVFLPLGMTRASVDIAPGLEPYQAIRYGSDGVAYPFYDFDHPGASAVYCSAHDLVRFGMFHLKQCLPDQKAILSEAAIEEMQTPAEGAVGKGDFGVGWHMVADKRGYRCANHNGGMGGVSTTLHLLPTEGIAVAVLANARAGFVYDLHEEILSALLPDYAERRTREMAEKKDEEKPTEAPFKPTPQLVGDWAGTVQTYESERPLTLSFKRSGDVHVQLGDQLKTLLNEVTFKEERLGGKMLGDIGTADANRRPYHIHLDMKLRGRVLNGAVLAFSTNPDGEGGAPGKRVGNCLSHWAELKKQRSAS